MSRTTTSPRNDTVVRRIIDAAANVFAGEGYAGARMDEIARVAGVNKAMLYYHVGDKSALYERVLHDALQRNRAIIKSAIDRETTSEGKFRALVSTIAELANASPHLPRLMLRELAGDGAGIPEPVASDMAAIFSMLCDILTDGIAEGRFRASNPLLTHLMIVGGIMVMTSAATLGERVAALAGVPEAGGDLTSYEPIARQMADIFLHGITHQEETA